MLAVWFVSCGVSSFPAADVLAALFGCLQLASERIIKVCPLNLLRIRKLLNCQPLCIAEIRSGQMRSEKFSFTQIRLEVPRSVLNAPH